MKFNKKLFNKLYSIFFVGLVLFLLIQGYKQYTCYYSKNAKTKFTMGKITKFETSRDRFLYYRFEIDDKVFNAGDIINNTDFDNTFFMSNVGHYFLVKYSVKKPQYSELLYGKPVPDSLKNCTNCVWDKPPF